MTEYRELVSYPGARVPVAVQVGTQPDAQVGTQVVAAETSTVFKISVDPPFVLSDGREVTAVNVLIHRPGNHWAYRVWADGDSKSELLRTKRSLEHYYPGLFDAVVVMAMGTEVGQLWGDADA